MLVARKSLCREHDTLALQHQRSLNHGRVALPRDRFVRSGATFSTRTYSKSFIIRHGILISPAGWRTLAGGNTPDNFPFALRPGGSPESTVVYRPIRPIRRIRPILRRDPRCKPLIKIKNGLSPIFYKPKIRPENKGIKPITNRHKPKNFKAATGRGLPRRSPATAGRRRVAATQSPLSICFFMGNMV